MRVVRAPFKEAWSWSLEDKAETVSLGSHVPPVLPCVSTTGGSADLASSARSYSSNCKVT